MPEKTYGVCQWAPEWEDPYMTAQDRELLASHRMSGLVCEIIGSDGPLLILKYGDLTFRLNSENVPTVHDIKFDIGDQVMYKERPGKICDIAWHYKNEQPMYLLEFDGKRSSRRYYNTELRPLSSD